jgi:peptidoglycan-N-acetylglucosamine deacetylase
MAKTYSCALCVLCITLVMSGGCKKFQKEGQMKRPGVALTFDDNRIDNWIEFLPFLDSAGVKATFYISNYNRFKDAQKKKLALLQQHGHEIAFHTTNHYNMEEYVYKANHTIDDLLRCEVEAGLKLMNRDGFYPVTFAYPYGAHNGVFDKALLHYFKSVRALNGTQDFTRSLVATDKNNVLYGLGIDRSSKRSDADINNILSSAKDNNTCAVFVAHDINSPSKFSVSLRRLEQIVKFVKENNLKFYTVSEISD